MRLVVILFFTVMGTLLGWIVPSWHAWVGALFGFCVGTVIAFGGDPTDLIDD